VRFDFVQLGLVCARDGAHESDGVEPAALLGGASNEGSGGGGGGDGEC